MDGKIHSIETFGLVDGKGVYPCHAGLVDFGIPITLDDETDAAEDGIR